MSVCVVESNLDVDSSWYFVVETKRTDTSVVPEQRGPFTLPAVIKSVDRPASTHAMPSHQGDPGCVLSAKPPPSFPIALAQL
jgi:hypothetical protein